MKKIILTMTLIASVVAGAMTLSAFTTAKQDASQIENSADYWKIFRVNVPYCDGDKGTCMGYGLVWVNTDTYQVAFSYREDSKKYDLSEYTKKDGYNMRFWDNNDSKYYYVNIYIPRSAFE